MSSLNNITNNFQILYRSIVDFSKDDNLSGLDKWNRIASYVSENSSGLLSVFDIVKTEASRTDVTLDYDVDESQLIKQISSESDNIFKIGLIITHMHQIIYQTMIQDNNYVLKLDGQEQMAILKKDIIYYVFVSDQKEKNITFHTFIILYALESLFNKRFYVGIDYEFNNKKIQLAQMNFEHDFDLRSVIMIINPNELEAVMMQNLITYVICNPFIRKILHGSDSLDIPYMYEIMLEADTDKIISFTRTLLDTRFLCEYYKLNKGTVTDSKCSIYDEEPERSAIYYFGVVSTTQQEMLTNLMRDLPPPHDIIWNIHKMPKSRLLYAQYDVLFLKYFYYRIINVATQDEPTDIGKKDVIEFYKHILYELTQFVYLEKRGITFLMNKSKTEVDPVNNFMIRKPGTIIKMIDVFNQVSIGIKTVNPKAEIDKLIKVNYYKAPILTLIKRMIYGILSKTCKIYKDKSTTWTDRLDNQFIFEFFHEMQFYYMERMFREIQGILEVRIRQICH